MGVFLFMHIYELIGGDITPQFRHSENLVAEFLYVVHSCEDAGLSCVHICM